MKYFLLLSLCTFFGASYAMKRKLLSRYENLEREIFIRGLYRDYSFGLIQQISPKNPIIQKVFEWLIAQGQQKYADLALKNYDLEPFEEYSLSELEKIHDSCYQFKNGSTSHILIKN